VRLGIYADLLYRAENGDVSTDRAFIRFIGALADRVDELVLFGRLDPDPGRGPYRLPERIRFVPLPFYERVTSVMAIVRSLRRASSSFATELKGLDAVWIFGPHPVALEFVRRARARRTPVVLGIRQDFPEYIARRLPGRRWLWAVPAAHVLDRVFGLLARRLPTVLLGEALAAKYRVGAGRRVHVTGISLVPRSAVIAAEDALAKDWNGELRLLSVGRLDTEKNPLLLPEILERLRRGDASWRLMAVGTGPLADEVADRAARLDVAEAFELCGYVPHDDGLLDTYRESHAFLHVSLTEGVPQVLFEAHAAGLPVVATDVGGVATALGDGARGLLVPPGDAAAVVDACERLRSEPELRERLIREGLEFARAEAMEDQLDRLVAFLEAQLPR
jgi:glycosyltransferase involved in cell wall biosynthesis